MEKILLKEKSSLREIFPSGEVPIVGRTKTELYINPTKLDAETFERLVAYVARMTNRTTVNVGGLISNLEILKLYYIGSLDLEETSIN